MWFRVDESLRTDHYLSSAQATAATAGDQAAGQGPPAGAEATAARTSVTLGYLLDDWLANRGHCELATDVALRRRLTTASPSSRSPSDLSATGGDTMRAVPIKQQCPP